MAFKTSLSKKKYESPLIIPDLVLNPSQLTLPKVKLAFSLTFHQDLGTIETFLKMTFRPGHAFCLYVDAKAPESFHRAVSQMVDCYKSHFRDTATIFKVERPVDIYWGHISTVEADLYCLRELLRRDPGWRYFLNLPGSMLPAFSINQIEHVLDKGLGGESFVISYPPAKDEGWRFKFKHSLEHQ